MSQGSIGNIFFLSSRPAHEILDMLFKEVNRAEVKMCSYVNCNIYT